MKIINYGVHYEIYSDDLQTFDKLPAATYKISFNPMSGFSLVRVDDFEAVEEKIYGTHEDKIEKVIRSYRKFNRSLGIILSGSKGMGKSLFVQLLAKNVVEKGMPVIMVTKPYKGVADFIEKIDQEAFVVFDEFEKVFDMNNEQGGESQNDFLGLFDGTSQKKRLYAITVNNLHKVSEFMLSRTGRFHYHIRFDYPSANEIEVYLMDKLEKQYYHQIKHVIAFANRVKLNYDSLRAIAFELNEGYSFGLAIEDLNILTIDDQRYDVKITFSNGRSAELKGQRMNLFSDTISVSSYVDGGEFISVSFDSTDIHMEIGRMIVNGKDVEFQGYDDNEIYPKGIEVVSVLITHHLDSGVNYKLMV